MEIDASPRSESAKLALAIYGETLDAIRANELMKKTVRRSGETLWIGASAYDLDRFDRVLVVGAGKAAAGMTQTLESLLGDRISDGIVVTKTDYLVPFPTPRVSRLPPPASSPTPPTTRIRILEASHPIPDESSVAAGAAIHALASSARPQDLIIVLLSGGASALMELPAAGITLDDLRTTTDLLLRAGAPIEHLNAVRSALSRLKAGGLARAASSAGAAVCLVLSDVLGNPLSIIGSGPCVATPDGAMSPAEVIDRYGLWDRIPSSVSDRIRSSAPPGSDPIPVEHHIIGDIRSALEAARDSAIRHGLHPLILTGWLEGEARHVGRTLGQIARDLPRASAESGFDCLILGGETTVTVTGTGSGGRSQELAVAAMISMDSMASIQSSHSVTLLAGGTDGADGPTDAAGGLVESDSLRRAANLGPDAAAAALHNNDAYSFLESLGGLIRTGPTGSNVGDIVLIISKGDIMSSA